MACLLESDELEVGGEGERTQAEVKVEGAQLEGERGKTFIY